MAKCMVPALLGTLGMVQSALASTAYGSLNNFDCVNDTGVESHGFEIELDFGRTTDVTYTYDYNHYGTPKITEDLSDPTHPRVFVRYESGKKADGSWAAYTAIPAGPISPTQGHQFTDPSVNFGGEHFGMGFLGTPVAVKYCWLIDDGTGNLARGPAVYISTPTFTYFPPIIGFPAQVIAAVVPPPPPAAPVYEFGVAQWVKEIKTTTHNAGKVHLNDLVAGDPGQIQPWANGEPSQVEVEWKILQTEFAAVNGGKNNELQGAPEGLPGGDETVTRRYEFYKYTGPLDAETGEAMGDVVAADGKHGRGVVTYADHFDNATGEWVTVTVNLANFIVVGDFFGAQMAGFDAAPVLGLIDHIENCDPNVEFAARTVVIAGGSAFLAGIKSGSLPTGMDLNPVTGVLSGTPTVSGVFTFTIEAADEGGDLVSRLYKVTVSGGALATYNISTSASPASGGLARGSGSFPIGRYRTVTAVTKAGYTFVDWTEAGVEVSAAPMYRFALNSDHVLVANFIRMRTITTSASPGIGGVASGGGVFVEGTPVTVTATPNAGYGFVSWTDGLHKYSISRNYTFSATTNRNLVANFVRGYVIATSSTPDIGGMTTGAGTYNEGKRVVLNAVPKAGYTFVSWTEGGVQVGRLAQFSFVAAAERNLVANFVKL